MIFLIIVACASFAVLFAEVSGIMQSFKAFAGLKRFKPFDCSKCLAFWCGLVAFTIYYPFDLTTDVFAVIGLAAVTSLSAVILSAFIKQITSGSGFTTEQREMIGDAYKKIYGSEPDTYCDECLRESFKRIIQKAILNSL